MPKFEVRKSTNIATDSISIIEYIANFTYWPTWSPWLTLEPICTVEYQGNPGEIGSGYLWDGILIGAGNMTLIAKDESSIEMDLHFLRPFKSHAQVRFEILGDDKHSVVTWIMNSQLPWYLFFIKSVMKNMIGMDFNRGLLMLKSQLETGSVPSEVCIIGERHQDTLYYIGLKGRATLDNIGIVIQGHIAQLTEYAQNQNIAIIAPWFVLYECMDKQTTESEFFTCIPIDHEMDISAPFVCDTLPACDTFVVQHKGPYHFIGNGWSLAMMASRHNKLKVTTKPMGIEQYLNNPSETKSSELLTDIILFKS